MIKPDQIPNEVVEALHTSLADDAGVLVPKGDCVAAIAAALNAWPDMVEQFFPNSPLRPPGIFLPLPQEGRDERA